MWRWFATFIVATILLFTWGGRNWAALGDLAHAAASFTARAAGQGHEKSFGYYFGVLDPLFIFTLIALAGVYAAICDAVGGTRKSSLPLVIYALLTFLIYSAIPYKTPWLALNLWLPLVILCGLGVEALWLQTTNDTGRWIIVVAFGALMIATGQQTKVFVFDKPIDEKNPYAYAHTTEDMLRLPARLEELAHRYNLAQPRIAVVMADAWPLPWYLRKFSSVGFWQPEQETGPADFFITTTDVPEKLQTQLKPFRPEYFGVRPNVFCGRSSPVGTATASGQPQRTAAPAMSAIHVFNHSAMATQFQVRIADEEKDYAAQAAQAAFTLTDALESKLSRFRANSEISEIAQLAVGETLRLTEPVFACLSLAKKMEAVTHGGFSICAAALQTQTAKPAWSLENFSIRCDGGKLEFDLGAIGKGFALDRMADLLREWSCPAFLLVAGGSSILAGDAPAGTAGWSCGLGDDNSPQRYWLKNCSLSGSGLAVKGSHILDPRTGKPAARQNRTWALCDTAGESDALSTACMVLNEPTISQVLSTHPDWLVFLEENNNARALGNRVLPPSI